MRIFIGIAVRVVHAVHDGVGAGIEKRSPLEQERKKIKRPFPEPAHRKHPVRCITVQEKGLAE